MGYGLLKNLKFGNWDAVWLSGFMKCSKNAGILV